MNNESSKSFVERFAKKSNNVARLDSKDNPNKNQESEQDQIKSNDTNEPNPLQTRQKVDPIKKAQSDLIYLVTGTDRDRPAWYYVLVDRLKVKMFLQAMKTNSINLDDFGKVIYSAYGEKPPEEISNKVKAEYGIED